MKRILFSIFTVALMGCTSEPAGDTLKNYFKDETVGVKTGGVRIIPIETMGKKFNVWTKSLGNSPSMKLLLLSGGPGTSHEYFECMESFLPAEGIELIYYDQLGTGFSDNPDDTAFWDLDRYVEEVEQVRKALGLNKDNCYLLGHSWGGLLGMQYALKYQDSIKGLIISNMMSDVPAYGKYAQEVLAKGMDSAVVAEIRQIESV
ncbi:MAG: proline iminopeptidase-family hydrolase [Chitinophagaceae bacterium]|nr:proline iminopeptidase-family hydrolase [Chitinophagaceae bacterium]